MTKVFFSGSRRLTRLDPAVTDPVDKIIAAGSTILVGDADGADQALQAYLARRHYGNVVVFCTGPTCRNNVGGWKTEHVEPPAAARKDFRYYALKDRKMSEEAACGLAVWDGESKGTLNNILNLLEQGKNVQVYFAPSGSFHRLDTPRDLAALLAECDGETVERLERQLHVKERMRPKQKSLAFA